MHSGLSSLLKERGLAQGDDPPAPTSPGPPGPSSVMHAPPSSPPNALGPARSSVEPISMGGSTSAPRPLAIPSADSPHSSLASGPLDGPLLELMPALSVSASASSSEESFLTGRTPSSLSRPSPGPPAGRRVVSAPWGHLASPPRSSPLSRSVGPDGEELPPWRRVPMRDETPFGSPASPPGHGGAFDPGRLAERQRRRRSSASFSYFTSGAVATGSLVGSFEESLLSGRMSAAQSAPLPFVASIGVLGSEDAPKRLKCPKHLHVPFGAVFYREPGGEATLSCPYVGVVNLDAHYHSLLVIPTSLNSDPASPPKLPRFPGFEVPQRGQIQLVLKNSLDTAFKPFLIPYDITGLDRAGHGGRTFLRQKSYAVADEPGDGGGGVGKGKLRFAVHLQFCSPPAPAPRKGKEAKSQPEPRFYLHRAIRVVFASRGLDLSDKLRVVHEGPGEARHGHHGADVERFAAYSGPGPEWDLARKKAKERFKLEQAPPAPHTLAPPPLPPYPPHTHSLSYPVLPASSASIPAIAPPLDLVAPSPFTPSPLVRSALPAPPFPPVPEPLTFERVPSPHRPVVLGRKLSAQSALSASRPSSAAGRSGSGERERIGR